MPDNLFDQLIAKGLWPKNRRIGRADLYVKLAHGKTVFVKADQSGRHFIKIINGQLAYSRLSLPVPVEEHA